MVGCKTVKYPIVLDCTGEALEIEDLDFVPYTGANKDVNLGEWGVKLGNLEFDTTPTNAPIIEGSLGWNATEGTLDLVLKGGDVNLQVGQEQVMRVLNGTGIALTKASYKAVRVNSAQDQRLRVSLAQASSAANAKDTIGLVAEDIGIGEEGFVTTFGLIENINTTGSLQSEVWIDGQELYLSAGTAGGLTKIKPDKEVKIGFVAYSHIGQGKIFVNISNIAQSFTTLKTFSSTGLLTSFTFNHLFGSTPNFVGITPLTEDAMEYSHITYNNLSVTIYYLVAPPVGVNNLIFNITII